MTDNGTVGFGDDYFPGKHVVTHLQLVSADGTAMINLGPLFSAFNFTEDLFSPCIYGNIEIFDQTGAVEKLGLTGAETLYVSFHSPEDRNIELTFVVYDHTIVPSESADGKAMNLMLVTPEAYLSAGSFTDGFFKGTISDIVQGIWQNLGSDRNLVVHDTTGIQPIIVPGQTPLEAIDFLANRAFDAEHASSYFTFFETVDGFTFGNLERIMAEGRNALLVPELLIERSFTFDSSVNLASKTEHQKHSLLSLVFNRNGDAIQRIRSGMDINTVSSFDIFSKKIETTEFDVRGDSSRFEHLDTDNRSVEGQVFRDKYQQTDCNNFSIIRDSSAGTDHLADVIGPRVHMMNALNQLMASFTMYGNSNIHPGMVIDLGIGRMDVNRSHERHQHLSGNWMVQSMTHTLTNDHYESSGLLIKSSYRNNG